MEKITQTVFKVILFSSLVTIFPKAVNCNSIDGVLQKRIDTFVENIYLPQMGVSGCALALVQNDGEILYTTGYGYADHSQKIPNGNKTQFLVASISKTITSIVAVKTLHEHFPELDEAVLDTPIQKLMPQANFTLNDRLRSEHSTFRDLLSHKMCLETSDFAMITGAFESTDEMIYRQRYATESCGFRTQFAYHNQMVLLAAGLIEQLINQDFVDYTEKFLKELGMHDSAFIRQTDDFSALENRAIGYFVIDGQNYPTNPDMVKRVVHAQAISGLYSSSNDMVRLIKLNLNKGKLDGKQIVPENVMLAKPSVGYQKMKFKNSDEDNVVESFFAYGLGLLVGSYNGWERISHSGKFLPYISEVSWYPALNIGIFSAHHESPMSSLKSGLHTFVFEALRGNVDAEELGIEHLKQTRIQHEIEHKENIAAMSEFVGKFKKGGNIKAHFNKETMTGTYGNVVSKEVEVFLKYNPSTNVSGLYISYGKWIQGWLESMGQSTTDDLEETELFKVQWETDIVQENYARGEKDFFGFVTISSGGEITFMMTLDNFGMIPAASFRKGVETRIENLDPIPWKSDRCE